MERRLSTGPASSRGGSSSHHQTAAIPRMRTQRIDYSSLFATRGLGWRRPPRLAVCPVRSAAVERRRAGTVYAGWRGLSSGACRGTGSRAGVHARRECRQVRHTVQDGLTIDDHGRSRDQPVLRCQFEVDLDVVLHDHHVRPAGGKSADDVLRLRAADAVRAVEDLEHMADTVTLSAAPPVPL